MKKIGLLKIIKKVIIITENIYFKGELIYTMISLFNLIFFLNIFN